ncbi:MAG TPA: lytic transglycosylase domain-containing protein, partial [Candidatus Angelobacter sp.]|nr:lytic transglycosylase domain-containing protein [Candidatus Angelobacter sp.]
MSDTTTPPQQFTSVIGDPFDPAGVSNLHQPGMLGISPDVWRSLAMFGSNMATSANARTPGGFLANGTGFAGPFAAAVGQSNQQGLQRGQTLSDIGYRNALAQNQRMQNYVTGINLPLQIAQNRMMLEMMQNPQAWAAKYGFGAPTISGGQTASGGSDNGTASDWKPTFGGATNAPQVPQAYVPFYEEASKRTGIPVNVLEAQSAQESGYNPGATGAAGEIGITQIKPDTARNPGYGLTGVQNPDTLRDPRANILFGADYLKARAGNVDWSDPAQVATALRTYNGGGDPQYAQHVMRYIPATQQQTAAAQPSATQQQTASAPASDSNPPPKDPSKMTDQEWLDWQSKTYPNLAQGGTQLPSESPAASSPYQTASNTPVAPPSQPTPQLPAAGQPVGTLGLVRLPNGDIGTPAPQQAQAAPAQQPAPQQQTAPAPTPQQQSQAQPQPKPAQQTGQADVLMARANAYEQQANQLENQRSQITVENARRTNFIKTLPAPMQMIAAQSPALQLLPMPPGDPAALRTAAQQFRANALELQNAPAVALAKAQNSNLDAREGGLLGIPNGDGTYRWVKNPKLEKVVDPATGQETYTHISPAMPGSPAGTSGTSEPVLNAAGQPTVAEMPVGQKEFQEKRGSGLAEQFNQVDENAAHAKESNYLFDNMRADSQTWDMNKFANWEGDARAYMKAIANSFGIKTPQMDQQIADFTAFTKSSGMLLREAVHETSSRAAVQEYNMIGNTLPNPTSTKEAFEQISAQW